MEVVTAQPYRMNQLVKLRPGRKGRGEGGKSSWDLSPPHPNRD